MPCMHSPGEKEEKGVVAARRLLMPCIGDFCAELHSLFSSVQKMIIIS